jgi:hypothetical protein
MRTNESFTNLRRFLQRQEQSDRCDLCNLQLPVEHPHLFDPLNRKVFCACTACMLLFSNGGETKYKRVPTRVERLSNFQMTDAQWDSLMIPIEIAFLFHSTPAGKVIALYPSPAGATESLLSLDTWNDIAEQNPELDAMEPDVEALLVNRTGRESASGEYFILPIDECYKLVGLIRTHWRGFTGGSDVWKEIAQFFAAVNAKAGTEAVRA